jgi:hypothetical protein
MPHALPNRDGLAPLSPDPADEGKAIDAYTGAPLPLPVGSGIGPGQVAMRGLGITDGTPELEIVSPFGIDSEGQPYYDTDGAAPGEAAWVYIDIDGSLTLTTLGGTP